MLDLHMCMLHRSAACCSLQTTFLWPDNMSAPDEPTPSSRHDVTDPMEPAELHGDARLFTSLLLMWLGYTSATNLALDVL
jgi:hypothetical protein